MIDATKPKLSEFSLDDADIYPSVIDNKSLTCRITTTLEKTIQERKKKRTIRVIWDNFNADFTECTDFVNKHWNEWIYVFKGKGKLK